MIECKICLENNLVEFKVGNTELLKCLNCEIIFNKHTEHTNKINEYYKEKYVLDKNQLKPMQRYFHRMPEFIKLISFINKYKSTPASLLDIGCDKGFFLEFSRHFGFEVFGVELSESARNYAQNLGLNVFENLESVNRKFDIIVMWHSLEHFPNPKQGILDIKKLLNDDGILLIRVPNFDNIWRRIFGKNWIWFQPQSHYFHFSPTSLKNLLNETGFETIYNKSSRPNNFLTYFSNYISKKSFKKYFGLKPTLKSYIYTIYEFLTGIEIFTISKKK